jgi:hypothetical protein
LSFVNDQAASTHGNVNVDSIFLSPSGEWKLGGFEVLSNPRDESAVLYVRLPGTQLATTICPNTKQTLGTLLPDPNTYAAPEVKSSGWTILKKYVTRTWHDTRLIPLPAITPPRPTPMALLSSFTLFLTLHNPHRPQHTLRILLHNCLVVALFLGGFFLCSRSS